MRHPVPWGGGGLCCGIASAVSLAAGAAVKVGYTLSFVDGIVSGNAIGR